MEPIFWEATIFSSLLTLLGTGLTLTYMTTRVPNFAHGSFAGVGLYLSLTVAKVWHGDPYRYLPLAFLLSGIVAVSLYISVLRPLMKRNASLVTLMIATVGFDLILLAVLNIYADYLSRVQKVTSRYFVMQGLDFRWFGYPGLFFVAPIAVAIILTLIHISLTKTKFGVAMRATIENPSLAVVMGINTGVIYVVSWFLAGGLAGVAGSLMAFWFVGNPDVGPALLPSIFAASIAGGFFNIYGALLGGFLVGIAEVLGTSYLSAAPPPFGLWVIAYRPIIPLIIIVATLLITPKGLSGVNWRALFRRRMK